MTVANVRYLKVCIVVVAWVGVVLAATHYSDKPLVLGRYSRSDLPPILWTPGYATAAFASNSAGD